MKPERPGRQRGVALITAVLMVALATMLAVDVGFRGFLDQRRSGTLFALDQGYEIALGAEAWAADFLRRDLIETRTDHLGETWARPLPPLPIEGGTVEGRLEDLQGRFNLNNLVHADGTANPQAVQQLGQSAERLHVPITTFEHVLSQLENLVGPEHARDYRNVSSALQTLRDLAVAADSRRSQAYPQAS